MIFWKILDHSDYCACLTGQAGLEAVFQVPMPGDSGSSPDAGSISNYFDLGDFSLQPQRNPYPTLTPPSC